MSDEKIKQVVVKVEGRLQELLHELGIDDLDGHLYELPQAELDNYIFQANAQQLHLQSWDRLAHGQCWAIASHYQKHLDPSKVAGIKLKIKKQFSKLAYRFKQKSRQFKLTPIFIWRAIVTILLLLLFFGWTPAAHADGLSPGYTRMCKATASAPSLTEGALNFISCDLTGNLRITGAGGGGTSSNFGAAFPTAGTAAGFKDNVGNMAAGNLDASGNLKTNCLAGCSAAGDQTTGSTALGAINAVITLPLAGERGAAFQLQSAGTLIGTVTPQCSFDGGTLYNTNGYIQDPVTGNVSLTATIASAQATTDYPVMCPQGASHVQLKVTAYTSGTANWLARSTVISWPNIAWGIVTTAAPTYSTGTINGFSLTTAGALRTDSSGVTQPVSGTFFQATQPVSIAATVTVTGGKTNNNAAPGATNVGALNAIANAADPVWTEGNLVAASVDLSGFARTKISNWLGSTAPTVGSKTSANSLPVVIASDQGTITVQGAKTNNNAAPGATNLGALTCLANAAQQTWTEGNLVLCSTNLKGSQRSILQDAAGNDRGVNVDANNNGQVSDIGRFADNGVAAATDRLNTLPSIYQSTYLAGTAATAGRNGALSQGTDGLLWTAALPSMRPASYHWSGSFAGSSTTFAAHIAGNATNTLLVTKIAFSCTQTTAGNVTVTVNKTSAASTGGTAATLTAVPDDSGFSAASSVAQSFTGTGPTVGTLVGQIDAYKLGCNATATAAPNDIYILNLRQKPIVLRGTAQTLEIGVGAAVTGGNYTVTFEGMEITTITP